jgi:hypothetical protein
MTNSPFANLIPSAVLVALMAYLSWPYLEPARSSANPPGKLPKITEAVLHPAVLPATKRDPFGASIRFELEEFGDEKLDPRKARGKPPGVKTLATGAAASKLPVTTLEKRTADTGTVAAGRDEPAQVASKKKDATKTAAPDSKDTSSLVLSATLLHGQQSLALINGRAYKPGDVLEGSTLERPLLLAEVHHHWVVVKRGEQLMNLGYSDSLPESLAGGPPKGVTSGRGRPSGPQRSTSPKDAATSIYPSAR